MELYKASPRYAGQLRLPGFCPRSFGISVAMSFKYPFDFGMPGLLYNMDRFEKQLVQAHFNSVGELPDWLSELGCTEPIAFPAKMTQDYPKLGLTLVGMPDAIFRKEDGSLCIVDYKTAKFKGPDDPFMPIYEAQLWGYAQLAQHHKLGDVSSAALVYFANTLKDFEDKPLKLMTKKGIQVPFEVKTHIVDVDLDQFSSLLKKFSTYIDLESLPKASEGCKTCERIDRLFDILHSDQSRQKVIADLLYRDSASLSLILKKEYENRREAIVRDSMSWEASLTEPLPFDWEYFPSPSDLQ